MLILARARFPSTNERGRTTALRRSHSSTTQTSVCRTVSFDPRSPERIFPNRNVLFSNNENLVMLTQPRPGPTDVDDGVRRISAKPPSTQSSVGQTNRSSSCPPSVEHRVHTMEVCGPPTSSMAWTRQGSERSPSSKHDVEFPPERFAMPRGIQQIPGVPSYGQEEGHFLDAMEEVVVAKDELVTYLFPFVDKITK